MGFGFVDGGYPRFGPGAGAGGSEVCMRSHGGGCPFLVADLLFSWRGTLHSGARLVHKLHRFTQIGIGGIWGGIKDRFIRILGEFARIEN